MNTTIRSSSSFPLWLLALLAAFLPGRAAAQGRVIDLDPSFVWEGSVDYAATGGSLLDDTCTLGLAPQAGYPPYGIVCVPPNPLNPNLTPDDQGDLVLATSSAELYGVPEDATVERAFVVYMASQDQNGLPDSEITLQPPGGNIYSFWVEDPTLTPEISYAYFGRYQIGADDAMNTVFDNATYRYYTYRIEITDQVRNHVEVKGLPLNGVWTIGQLHISDERHYLVPTQKPLSPRNLIRKSKIEGGVFRRSTYSIGATNALYKRTCKGNTPDAIPYITHPADPASRS